MILCFDITKNKFPSGKTPTPFLIWTLDEPSLNFGCISPSINSIGPDWVAYFTFPLLLKLSVVQMCDSFSFVVSDYWDCETVFLLPEKAYNYTNTLGSDLTFSKSKLINFFKETDVDIWKKDSFYKLQANSNIIDVNYSSDPIKYSIMFSSSENNIVDYFDDNIIQVLFEKCSGKSNYDGLDLFFRCMPLDGSDFRIKAQAVRYITYRLSKPSEDYKYKGFILYKDERKLDNGKVYIKY